MYLTYKYRLLPTRRQHATLTAICEEQRQLYNAALQERIECYRKTGRTLGLFDQTKSLTEWRHSDLEATKCHRRLQTWTLICVDKAYLAFFRRLRMRSNKVGFPRFRGKGRWNSFGFSEFCGISFDGKRLRFAPINGGLRVHTSRPLPKDANIRSCVFRRDYKGWYVCFNVKLDMVSKRMIKSAVGLDLGIKVFAYQSDGIVIPNPQVARKAEKVMRRRQRALARCKRGSKRRQKVRRRLAQLNAKIVNTRTTWLHQRSARIISDYDLVVAEDLNIKGMIKNPKLARSISDAGWGRFLWMAAYKAEKAGKYFITINPKNTSQKCSGCGELVPKSLAVRIHSCPHCGLVIDRDWNASKNILYAAVRSRKEHNVTQWGVRALRNLDLVGRASTKPN